MQVELAEAADAAAIAELHVDVWRATYADLAPPEALERRRQLQGRNKFRRK